MKKALIAAALYVLFGAMIFGVTVYGLIMWAEEVECYGATKTNRQLVTEYVERHYPEYHIKFDRHVTYREVTRRQGTVLVEIIETVSHGRYGLTRDGYGVYYNRRVKRGKRVTSYLIYNPENNVIDDVVAVVDNKKVR